jgi:tetratricopeptide (TPR) repeat protein
MKEKSQPVIFLNQWLDESARSSEKLRHFKEAAHYWSHLLQRLTYQSSIEHIDVTRLAAIHYHLGLAHRALNDDRKSLYHLKYSVRLNSTEARYYDAFGRAFLSGGHWRIAKAQFEKAIRLDPKNVAYLRQAAWVLLMMGRKSEALVYARKAFELQKNKDSLFALVRVYMEMNMYLQALQLLKTAKRTRRVVNLIEECVDKLELTAEGAVMKCLRKGITCDGNPFSLWDLRKAEEVWIEFCVAKMGQPIERVLPNVWAAALSWFVLYSRDPNSFESLDQIATRFGATSLEIWPRLKDLQESLQLTATQAA